jgi:hypothetical protein
LISKFVLLNGAFGSASSSALSSALKISARMRAFICPKLPLAASVCNNASFNSFNEAAMTAG